MTNEKDKVISAGVDWLTVTEVTGAGVDELALIAQDIKQQFFPGNITPERFTQSGYSGVSYGPLKFGTREPEQAIMIISGELAREAYPGIPIVPDRVTRIDLQVTVALRDQDREVALRHHNELRRLTVEEKDDTVWKLISSPTGDTLYLGKRTHARLLRFYDKSLDYKMDETGWAWRYEVEYKKKTAKDIAKTVSYMSDPYADIASIVWADFKKRGFAPSYEATNKVTAMEVGIKYKTPEGTVR